ncbi:MAG: DUF2169 domain-containing protein [Desulfobacula sp.]|nr:DUF2169 domain-containing protein [Desulfobacula sp.]
MKIIRPLQISFNHQVLEQNRRFYFTVSTTLGINLETGEELLDLNFLKDVFESMGENPLPDMGMPKPNGEFLVSGSFFAADNQPVTGGEVKVRLDKKEKKLIVFGPRAWKAGIPSRPEQIISMPIEYPKAFGGRDYEKNPDGIGFGDGLLPCIEDPKRLVASKRDKPDPVGFGPFYSMLPQRMQYQGTYDADYKMKFFPGYPEDHDWKYFLCAPFDQWIKNYYKGDESFGLYNMHPKMPSIEGALPGLYARCFVNRNKEGKEVFGELPLNLDTIWFFPEKLLGLLIFRGVTEVGDDEAETIKDILCAYEDRSQPPRSFEYYKAAFEKRRNSDDDLLKNLNTRDLIPEGHKSAMELLMEMALSSDNDSEFAKNIGAKAESMQQMADEKIEEAIQKTEKSMENIDIPDKAWEHIPNDAKEHMPGKKGGHDIRKLMEQKSDTAPDPDLKKFNNKLESILPGITAGDAKKIDMKDFSFDKLDEIMDAVDEFGGKKKKDAMEIAKKGIDKAKEQIKEQIKTIDKQIEDAKAKSGGIDSGADQIKALENSKEKIDESLKVLDDIDLDETSEKKVPLPRVNSEEIKDQINMEKIKSQTDQINPQVMEAMQHVQSIKAMGIEDEKTKEMEHQIQDMQQQIQEAMETATKQLDKGLMESEISFKETYIMAAHFMDEGLSPHKKSLEEVKQRFLEAVSNKQNVSNRDWACIDLSGENLDGIDLSGAFLEQVNFTGASLKGANLSGAIMARAILDNADLAGATLEEANVGGVHAHGANFTKANFKSAKLSKGDFTKADFTKAILEDIESLEIVVDKTNFTRAHMPEVIFLEINISGAQFIQTRMNGAVFMKCSIENCDFSESVMCKCAFVDTSFENCEFNKTDLSNACFVATEPEKTVTKKLNFKKACLKQANFQNMHMQDTDFSFTNMENVFFGGTDLSGANLNNAQAKNAQFRKADLTRATLDNINLDQGSLAKANLAGASFKKANLHAVDFLRSNISNTDFSWANLDTTLIEYWRPE